MKLSFFTLVYCFLFLTIGLNSFAQKGTQIGFGPGLNAYRGDLAPNPFGSIDLGFFGGHIRYSVSPRSTLKLSGKVGSYYANIEEAQIKAQELNYSITDSLAVIGRYGSVSLSVEVFPFGRIDELTSWDLYVGVGIGWLSTSIKLSEGSSSASSAAIEQTPATSTYLPFVLGANFGRNTSTVHMHLYFGFDYTFTDLIDGVSNNFNPNDNDHFFLAGLGIGINLGNLEIDDY